ncbi:MAG: GNAT family N-acetyltransferase [Burkholderiales bacterium]|nr:GNAT family N-acetyltransferase [Burkholderiales bacterium]
MVDFTQLTDTQIVDFVADHFFEFSDDLPPQEFPKNIHNGIKRGDLVILKDSHGFAVVARANRLRRGDNTPLPPNAELIFIYVAPEARGRRVARAMIEEIKAQYMEDQALELFCVGSDRRRMFEACGFRVIENESDTYTMVCDQ